MRSWLSRLRVRFWHFRSDTDLRDELRSHLEMQADEDRADGIPAAEAERLARLRLGDHQVIVEKMRDQEFSTILEGWFRDFRLGVRALRKSPVFCLTVILTLALGIGANTAIFTLLHGLLLRSLPVLEPSRLARIDIVLPATGEEWGLDWGMYQQILRQQRSFSRMSAWVPGHYEAMADSEGTLRRYNVALVSGDGFPVLGVRPYLGRLIEPYDDVGGGSSHDWSAVLSYDFWME